MYALVFEAGDASLEAAGVRTLQLAPGDTSASSFTAVVGALDAVVPRRISALFNCVQNCGAR